MDRTTYTWKRRLFREAWRDHLALLQSGEGPGAGQRLGMALDGFSKREQAVIFGWGAVIRQPSPRQWKLHFALRANRARLQQRAVRA